MRVAARVLAGLVAVLVATMPATASAGSAGGARYTTSGGQCSASTHASHGMLVVVPVVTFGYDVSCTFEPASISVTSRLHRDGVVVEEIPPWHCTSCADATGRQSRLFAEPGAYHVVTDVVIVLGGLARWADDPATLGCLASWDGRTLTCRLVASA